MKVLKVDKEKGNKGFALALLEPAAFAALRHFCRENGISQHYLEILHQRFRHLFDAPKHPSGIKKRTNRQAQQRTH